jgi:hypothetical protein
MKPQKLVLIGLLIVAFVAFFAMRPVREKACPLTKSALAKDPELIKRCTEEGGVLKDGKCTCPE